MFVISKPSGEVLDEFYFVNFLRWFMIGIDHTPYQLNGLSVITSPFFYVFGDNWFSWRFPIVVLGMVFVYFFYKVAEKAFGKDTAIIASMIVCLSPTIFTHSGLMLRDVPVMAFGFIGLYMYLKKRYYLAFMIIGLSMMIKETAILFAVFIVLHYVLANRQELMLSLHSKKFLTKHRILKTLACLGILTVSFLIPLTVYDNVVTVYEYETTQSQFSVVGKDKPIVFDPYLPPHALDEKFGPDGYYFANVNVVKDPIHHISLYFTKGQFDIKGGFEDSIWNSIIPGGSIGYHTNESKELHRTVLEDDGYFLHYYEFGVKRTQSIIEIWWFVSFWMIAVFIPSSIFMNKKNMMNTSMLLIPAFLAFLVPFLIIDELRFTFSYYVIYYLPFMALGMVLIIDHCIKNKNVKRIVYFGILLMMLCQFVYEFPIQITHEIF